jgi:hypothetical protein
MVAVAIIGAILGGTFVAICMVLPLIGGFLSILGGKPRRVSA